MARASTCLAFLPAIRQFYIQRPRVALEYKHWSGPRIHFMPVSFDAGLKESLNEYMNIDVM